MHMCNYAIISIYGWTMLKILHPRRGRMAWKQSESVWNIAKYVLGQIIMCVFFLDVYINRV